MFRATISTSTSKINICILGLFLVLNPVWSETYHFASHGGGSQKEEFLDFKVDKAENSYVLLKYDSNVTFGNETYSNKSKNSLLVKYDKNGNQLMTKNIIAEWTNQMFGAIGVSDNGTVVAASRTKGGELDGHAVYGGTFIGKLGANGNFEWVLQPVETIDRVRQFIEFRVTAIEVTRNDIYVAATANGKITLNGVTDPGYAHDNLHSALLIKMDHAGAVLWIKQIPTPDVDNHRSIGGGMDHILPSADGQSIYVAGKVGNGSYNPYEVAYVAKFKTDGTFLWVKRTSSSGSDSWGIAETSNGDLVTGFGVGGAQVIDFGSGASLEPSDTGWFGALARLDKNGNIKTLKYVTDALYSDASNIGARNLLRLRHLTVNQNDQAILLGEIVGTHSFKNNLEMTSSSGLLGASKDAALIICDLNFNPIEAYANTGGNNEWGHKCVTKGNRIYYSGVYDSYSHPFLGSHKPKFGDFTFESAGNQDIFVTSVSVAAPPISNPAPRLEFTRQSNSLTLSWPASDDINTILEFSPNLTIDSWGTLNMSPTLENERWQITLPVSDDSGFYRLIEQE
jgi:hypothetical protein